MQKGQKMVVDFVPSNTAVVGLLDVIKSAEGHIDRAGALLSDIRDNCEHSWALVHQDFLDWFSWSRVFCCKKCGHNEYVSNEKFPLCPSCETECVRDASEAGQAEEQKQYEVDTVEALPGAAFHLRREGRSWYHAYCCQNKDCTGEKGKYVIGVMIGIDSKLK